LEQRSEKTVISRRTFLKYGVYGIGGAIFAGLAAPLLRYFFAPVGAAAEQGEWIAIARTSEIPLGTPTRVVYEERSNDAWVVTTHRKSAWVVTEDGRDFTVFDPHCTHLGCPYTWVEGDGATEGHFDCPCHGGVFGIDGSVEGGPPPRPLDRITSRVEEDSIMVRDEVTKGKA